MSNHRSTRGGVAVGLGVVALLILTLGVGCSPPAAPPDAQIEDADVPPPPDINVDPTKDEQAAYRSDDAQLPPDFPSLPLPRNTAVLDQEASGTRATIVLLVPQEVDDFRTSFPAALARHGWKGPGRLGEEPASYQSGDRQVTISATADGPSTRVTIGY